MQRQTEKRTFMLRNQTPAHTSIVQKISRRAAEFNSQIEDLRTGFDYLNSVIGKLDALREGKDMSDDDLETLWRFLTDVDRATCLVRYADNPIALAFLGEKLDIDRKSLTQIVDDVLCIERDTAKHTA